MLVEELPGGNQNTVRHVSEDLLCHPHSPSAGGQSQACRISPIGQLRSARPPAVFERDKARVVGIRTTQIELASSVSLSFLDRIPEQEVHRTEIVEPLVGASILVDKHAFERDRENARDRLSVLRGHANLRLVTQAVQYIAKPVAGMGR